MYQVTTTTASDALSLSKERELHFEFFYYPFYPKKATTIKEPATEAFNGAYKPTSWGPKPERRQHKTAYPCPTHQGPNGYLGLSLTPMSLQGKKPSALLFFFMKNLLF